MKMKTRKRCSHSIQQENDSFKKTKTKASHQLSMPDGCVDYDGPIHPSSEESAKEEGPHISPEEQEQLEKDGRLQNEECARTALEYYNKKNRTNYELVDVGSSAGFLYDGIQFHCNFQAKPKLSSPDNGDHSSAKLFFAELYLSNDDEPFTFHVVGCRIIKGKTASCQFCRGDIQHPSHGFRIRYRTDYDLRSYSCYSDY